MPEMYRFPWVSVIVTLSLVLLILLAAETIMRPQGQNATIPQPVTVTPAVPGQAGGFSGPTGGTSNPTASAAALAAAADAAARAELKESAKLLAEAAADADQALDQIIAWETDIEPLRDNADGRVVAAHADLARQMAYLLQQPRPARTDIKQLSERIGSLRSETDRLSAAATAQRLTPEQAIEVQELHRRSREAHALWTESVERARAIAREARRQQPPPVAVTSGTPAVATPPAQAATATPAPPVSEPTSAPAAVPSAAAESPSPAVQPVVAAVPPPAAEAQPPPGKTLKEKVAEIDDQNKIQATKEKMDKEAKQKRDAEISKALQDEKAARIAAEKAKLVAEARSDEVQRALQPFLVKRNLQPRLAGASVQWRQTADQQPMSLLALENVGALDDTVQGLSTLARIGSHRELSSPRWDYNPSPRTWSSDTQDRLKQAQELLRRLGPTLVDERLLSP